MKNRFFSFVKKAVAPVALVAAMAAFSPSTAMAQNRGGHQGGRGSNGGHSYAAPNRGNFNGGHSFSEPRFNGGERREFRSDRGFQDDREHFGGRRYYRPGFGYGVGVYPSYGYGYVAPACNPAGFYDQWGNWRFYPGCAVPY
jgi:hypothetical protein